MYDDIAAVYDQIFPLNQSFLAFLKQYLQKPGSCVLDLGCGSGSTVDALVRAGYKAAGIDSSMEMIQLAKRKYEGSFTTLRFTQIDQLSPGFDCIYSVGNSFSYLPVSARMDFFRVCRRLLSTGGRVVFQVVNWDRYLINGTMNFEEVQLPEGRTFLREYVSQADGTVLFNTGLQEKTGEIQSWSASLYPIDSASFADGLSKSGYSTIDMYGDYTKHAFIGEASPALIVTARASE